MQYRSPTYEGLDGSFGEEACADSEVTASLNRDRHRRGIGPTEPKPAAPASAEAADAARLSEHGSSRLQRDFL